MDFSNRSWTSINSQKHHPEEQSTTDAQRQTHPTSYADAKTPTDNERYNSSGQADVEDEEEMYLEQQEEEEEGSMDLDDNESPMRKQPTASISASASKQETTATNCENCGAVEASGRLRRDSKDNSVCKACYSYEKKHGEDRPMELEMKRRQVKALQAKAAKITAEEDVEMGGADGEGDEEEETVPAASTKRAAAAMTLGASADGPMCSNCAAAAHNSGKWPGSTDSAGRPICYNCKRYLKRNGTQRPVALEDIRLGNTKPSYVTVEPRAKRVKVGTGITTSCVPCAWRCRPCSRGKPCDQCDAMAKSGRGDWDCYYDPIFVRPKGPKPAMYNTTPVAMMSMPPPTKRPTYAPKFGHAAKRNTPLPPTPTAIAKASVSSPYYLNVNNSNAAPRSNGAVNTPAIQKLSASASSASTATSATATPIKDIADKLQNQLDGMLRIASTYADNAHLRGIAEKSALDTALKLEKLERYLTAEKDITGMGFTEGVQMELVLGNYEGYMKEMGLGGI